MGFFTVVAHEPHGLFGGYLLLNLAGRPLAFHCTAPVKPSRAQEILFGPTLEPYLVGEQIGQALVAKGQPAPFLICTDTQIGLCLREFIQTPVARVLPPKTSSEQGSTSAIPADSDHSSVDVSVAPPVTSRVHRLDGPHGAEPAGSHFGVNRLAWHTSFAHDQVTVANHCGEGVAWDLIEPFTRIRRAIDEAQRSGR